VTATLMDMTLATQENLLSAMDTSQSFVLESVKATTATARRVWSSVPLLSAIPLPSMPSAPGWAPWLDPMGAVEVTYDFAERVMASQRSFAEGLVAAWSAPAAEG
jgi:hypothetical protein